MPIYEFYCQRCNTIFNFFSRRVNTTTIPGCPRCARPLQKQMSAFATLGRAREDDAGDLAGIDEAKMERVLGELTQEAGRINEDDPRQMAQLMRKFTDRTGISLGEGMEQALARLEAGENPEQIEQEMGELFDGDDDSLPFELKKSSRGGQSRTAPLHDETLYELE